ncbi:putative membrane protein [Actinokineospora spheciospongiae]|uniref:Putative membrane protein n=1 Tax=Actinokineospora spheciospongiae TaxID=909613 RepID=W7J9X1_9PSEU|nr:MFS transporter [Actinokineospora spheciospongiae]EWC62829.1 putative membrane protein [Actinokineospora spheciospongiae]
MTAVAPVSAQPRVGRRFVGGMALASLGLWTALYTPVQVLLAQQLAVIAPADKESALGFVTGLGALVAVVANPLAGALSDRTTSRFGRRKPWVAGGAVLAAAGLLFLLGQSTVAGVAAGWVVVQVALSAMLAGLVATVPDQVPVRQRGVVSAWVGATQPMATLAGTALVTLVVGGYALVAGVLLVLVLPFLFWVRDDRAAVALPPLRLRGFLASFTTGLRTDADFRWAWLTRFLIQLGNATGTLYLLYFLRDEIRYAELFPGKRAEQGLLLLVLIYTVGIVVSAFVGGVVSDRLGRRKGLVTAAGLVIAAGSAPLAVWPTWPVTVLSAVLLGLGYGVYVSVDQALITQVLPTDGDRGRDLGVISVANSLPHVLGPVIAAPLVSSLGGYPALFAVTALLGLLGAVLVRRIKNVP